MIIIQIYSLPPLRQVIGGKVGVVVVVVITPGHGPGLRYTDVPFVHPQA